MTVNEELLKDFEDLTSEKDRGVLKRIVKAATTDEKACHKDTCNVRYVGTYMGGEEDGKEFDRSDNFNFQLGVGNVIKAWDICVASMKKGEVCELIVAPEYGYNDGKTMKFEIELFSSKGEDISEKKDGSIRKSTLEEGEGLVNPAYGVEAKITYRTISVPNATPVELTYLTGDPAASNLHPAIDVAVRTMTLKEVAKVEVIDPKTGDSGSMYEVCLVSFEKIKHLSSLPNFEEQMKYADTLKERANGHLKATKYFLAVQTYKRLASDLEYLVTNGPQEKTTLDAIKAVVHNNTALAYIKMKDAEKAIKECEKAIQLDLKSEKAHFRLGQCFLLLNDHEEALKHFKACLHFHPNNIDAMKMKQFCDDQIAKAKQVEKARFRGIFNRLKETGLGLPDEPEPMEEPGHDHAGCDSCCGSDEEEPVKEAA